MPIANADECTSRQEQIQKASHLGALKEKSRYLDCVTAKGEYYTGKSSVVYGDNPNLWGLGFVEDNSAVSLFKEKLEKFRLAIFYWLSDSSEDTNLDTCTYLPKVLQKLNSLQKNVEENEKMFDKAISEKGINPKSCNEINNDMRLLHNIYFDSSEIYFELEPLDSCEEQYKFDTDNYKKSIEGINQEIKGIDPNDYSIRTINDYESLIAMKKYRISKEENNIINAGIRLEECKISEKNRINMEEESGEEDESSQDFESESEDKEQEDKPSQIDSNGRSITGVGLTQGKPSFVSKIINFFKSIFGGS